MMKSKNCINATMMAKINQIRCPYCSGELKSFRIINADSLSFSAKSYDHSILYVEKLHTDSTIKVVTPISEVDFFSTNTAEFRRPRGRKIIKDNTPSIFDINNVSFCKQIKPWKNNPVLIINAICVKCSYIKIVVELYDMNATSMLTKWV